MVTKKSSLTEKEYKLQNEEEKNSIRRCTHNAVLL